MRHRVKKELRGPKDRRRKELRALASAVILFERIETTHSRARIARSKVERLITRGKKPGLPSYRMLLRDLPIPAAKKIVEVLRERYSTRPGGYTRIIHSGKYKDGTDKVILELVQ